ncbi:MAG TPA: L,D-transpeptidase family protein [Gemmatimonadales bacterium]|jgi:murein L,D-transpeptidase YcbB/YkuD
MVISCRAVTVTFRPSLIVWPCLIGLLGAVACRRAADPIGQEIRNAVSADKPPAYMEGVRWKLVKQIYEDRGYRPLWVGVRRLPERTKDLIANLCDAEHEGLRPVDYRLGELRRTVEQLRPSLAKQRPEAYAVLDLELTRRFLDYGADLLAGRLDPKAVSSGWYIRARRSTIDSTLRAALRAEKFPEIMAPLRPRQPEYAELVKALASYREILRNGGWPEVPSGRELRHGDRGERVAVLRRRLRITGDLRDSAEHMPVYDIAVVKAVERFQARHGIPSNGIVDAATRAALNVPVDRRIRQLQLNLERYRWLPTDLGPRYISVNIPDYELYGFDGGKPVLRMRVVVGDEYGKATPVFADSMTFVVFRPYWYVPQRILVHEFLPRIRKKRSFLARHHLEVVDAKRESLVLNPGKINWSRADTTQIRLRQKQGSSNQLGLVKFMFPNQFSVYLHDTPERNMFERRKRTLSHGCVWVEKPLELAEYVLAGQADWNEEKIREAMETAPPTDEGGRVDGQSVTLERPVQVYIVYLTAFVRDGVLNFRADPYGKDREAIARLGKPMPSNPELCEELQKMVGG